MKERAATLYISVTRLPLCYTQFYLKISDSFHLNFQEQSNLSPLTQMKKIMRQQINKLQQGQNN